MRFKKQICFKACKIGMNVQFLTDHTTGDTIMLSKRWLTLALTVFLVVAVSSAALAAEFTSDEDTYRLAAGEVVEDDLFVSALEVYIDGTVRGDLFVAANYIEISPTGTVEGDLFAAANGIVVKGTIEDDMRGMANAIELSGTVGDDAMLAAGGGQFAVPIPMGTRSIQPGLHINGEIGGDALIGASGGDISGSIGGDLLGGLQTLTLSGPIGGNATIYVEDLHINDTARIAGTLTYTAAESQEFPAGVVNDIRFNEQGADTGSQREGAGSALSTTVQEILSWALRTIAILVGVAIVGWFLTRFSPNLLARPVAAIRIEPLKTGVYGLLAAVLLIFLPIASILLVLFVGIFWGIVPGIVMFIFLFASMGLVWFLSPLITGLWLGENINERLGSSFTPLIALLVGALLIVILGRIPCLGWLIYLLSFILALGGLLRSGLRHTDNIDPLAPVPPAESATMPAST